MVPTQDFLGLVAALRATQKKIRRGLLANLYEKVVRDTPEPLRDLLVSSTDDDIDANVALDAPTKGKLKTSRNRLRRMVSASLSGYGLTILRIGCFPIQVVLIFI